MPSQIFEGNVKAKGNVYYVTATVDYFVDNNYGADADGRRGMPMLFVEDVLHITALDGEDNVVTDEDVLIAISDAIADEFNPDGTGDAPYDGEPDDEPYWYYDHGLKDRE